MAGYGSTTRLSYTRKTRFGSAPSVARVLVVCAAISLCFVPGVAADSVQAADAAGPRGTQDPQELLAKARTAELNHNFPAAAQFYKDYLKIQPQDPQILQRLGLVNYLSDHFEAAIPPFGKALTLDPTLWGSALYLGVSYYRVFRFADAVRALRQALVLKPDLPEAQFWLGSSLVALDQPESAIPYLTRAAQHPKWGAQADDLLIKAYRKTAENCYQRIAKVAPDSYRVHLVKAELLDWKGIDNQAVWEARQALARNPNVEGAHRLIGQVYWRRKGFAEGAQEFRAELQINPLDPESSLRLGEFSLAQREPSKAVTFLRVAQTRRAGTPGETWHFLGEAELALHNNAAAIADLKEAVAQNPTDAANHRLLAVAYRATGQLDLAAREEQSARNTPSARTE